MAALRGEPVDRVPLSFWQHNFATENAVDGFVAETLRLAREFDWDYLKPQSRAQCFAEAWGFTYQASGERATPFTTAQVPCANADDLGRLQPASASAGALGEQLEALRHRMVKTLPRARLVEIPRAVQTLHEDNPEGCARRAKRLPRLLRQAKRASAYEPCRTQTVQPSSCARPSTTAGTIAP
jgi:hypothetical protein